jgi:hypothetical protein
MSPEAALAKFAKLNGLADSTSQELCALKLKLMGPTNPVIVCAQGLQDNKEVDWRGEVGVLVSGLGPMLLQVRELQHVWSWVLDSTTNGRRKPTSKDLLFLRVRASVEITLPAAQYHPHGQGSSFTRRDGSVFEREQPLTAAYMRITVAVTNGKGHKQAQRDQLKRDPQAEARLKAALVRKVQPVLYSTAAALLKWQLHWQLTGQQRRHLNSGAFGRLSLADAFEPTTVLAPTLGMAAILQLNA